MAYESARINVSYYTEDGDFLDDDDHFGVVPEIGSGLILSAPGHSSENRWRVVDVWMSYAKHSPFNYGAHVFLRDVANTADDRPQRVDPSYYRGDDSA